MYFSARRPKSLTASFGPITVGGAPTDAAVDSSASVLLLQPDGRVQVADFGLVRDESEGSLTRSGEVAGTPHYMSPEQARLREVEVDHRTDRRHLGREGGGHGGITRPQHRHACLLLHRRWVHPTQYIHKATTTGGARRRVHLWVPHLQRGANGWMNGWRDEWMGG